MEATIPKNYKNGKYILGKYKFTDFILLCTTISVGFFVAVYSMLSEAGFVIIIIDIIVVTSVVILTLPVPKYQSFYMYLIQRNKYNKKTKKYRWGGINYEI